MKSLNSGFTLPLEAMAWLNGYNLFALDLGVGFSPAPSYLVPLSKRTCTQPLLLKPQLNTRDTKDRIINIMGIKHQMEMIDNQKRKKWLNMTLHRQPWL